MPVSWVIAALTVYALLRILAATSGGSISGLLRTESLWPLVVILPAVMFGKVLGLMASNLIALCIPAFRRAFEDEEAQTGRRGFAKPMEGLARAAVVLAIVTVLGSLLFLRYR
jgi:hypothetical protein